MEGKGRFGVLAVWCDDPVLSVLAPIGLAAAAGTALVVDLPAELRLTGRTLADIAVDGPRLDELSPGRTGVGLISAGTLPSRDAVELVGRLSRHWPAVVVRRGDRDWDGPTVPVRPLYPGWLAPAGDRASVWQPVASVSAPPGPGPVLPPLRRASVRRILGGWLPRRSRWLAAWAPVWELPWA